ncbi:hypothetical protein AVEN_115174-1 [Araneus ventricosus]|uniref:Uncharacterized protein n=1 Tax=Araneus ventricosus TaxID=182803 RepID=A0A4Y1ZXI1_ARAVE|nr:hypothetical protein AVEN_115174-1 [Araneus ventricosus]
MTVSSDAKFNKKIRRLACVSSSCSIDRYHYSRPWHSILIFYSERRRNPPVHRDQEPNEADSEVVEENLSDLGSFSLEVRMGQARESLML